jgi:hypothetical protein
MPVVAVPHNGTDSARRAADIADALSGEDIVVRTVTMGEEPAGRLATGNPAALFRLVALLRRERVSVLHCLPGTTSIGAIAAKLAGAALIVEEGTSPGWLARRIGRSAAAVVACSERAARAIIADGVSAARVSVVWASVPDCDVHTNLREREAVRSRHGVLDESWLIGAQAGGNDDGCFLQAASIVRLEAPGTKFIVMGNGAMHQDLQRRAAVLGLNGSVVFAGTQPDAAQYVGAMDVAVVTEGAARFGIQAMGLGRPLVALDRGENGDFFPMGEAGLLVPPDNPLILAHAILEVMRHPEAVERMRKRGRELFAERHSAARMIAGYRELYLDVWRERQPAGLPADATPADS